MEPSALAEVSSRDAGDLAEAPLERGRHARSHGLGVAARQAGVDADGRELDRAGRLATGRLT